MCELTFRKSQGHCEGVAGITEKTKCFLSVANQSDHLSCGKNGGLDLSNNYICLCE